jgi:hypothetical protein
MGLALAAVGLLRLDAPALVIVLIADCVALIGLITYSYVVWRSDPDRDTFGR